MPRKTLVLDLETASIANLKKIGTQNYASNLSTMITVMAFYEVEHDKMHYLVHGDINTDKNPDTDAAYLLSDLIENPNKYKLVCHNHGFEKTIMERKLLSFAHSLGLNTSPIFFSREIEWVDTMTLSNIFRGPAGLEKAARFFNVSKNKDSFGNSLMKKVSVLEDREELKKPTTTTLRVPTVWTEIRKGRYMRWGKDIQENMVKYCIRDVEVTAALYKKFSSKKLNADLGTFKKHTKEGIESTNKMNKKGVKVDMYYLKKLGRAKEVIDYRFNRIAQKYFGVKTGAQKKAIIDNLQAKGYKIEKLGKKEIKQAIKNNPKHKEINKALKLYTKYNKISLNKVQNAIDTAHHGFLCDMFRFCGAYTTGRWTSYGVQLQNLPRPSLSLEEVKEFINKPADEMANDPDAVVSAIRACLIPDKFHKFFVADLSQIEARRGLEFAGYIKTLNKMKKGYCLYTDMAADIFNMNYKDIKKGSKERDVGKVAILSLQYGKGAQKFKDTLRDDAGIDMTLDEAKKAVNIYRQKYSGIVKLWRKYENELQESIIGNSEFRVKLATGRYLNYGKLKMRPTVINGKKTRKAHYYDGDKWKSLWGGVVYQNIVQAECRDIMLLKINGLHEKKQKVLMTVHDEVIIEVYESEKLDKLIKIWDNAGREEIKQYFPNLPIASDCLFLDRYYSH